MNERNIPEPAGFTRSWQLLNQLEYATTDRYSCALHDRESASDPACIRKFFQRELEEGIWDLKPLRIVHCPGISDLPALQSPAAGKILLSMHVNGQLPRTVADLAKVIGLGYGARIWGKDQDNFLFSNILSEADYRITCVEDVYEYLRGLDVPEEEALYFADKIRTGSLNVSYIRNQEELDCLGCGKWFLEAVRKINYLLFRAQCLQQALETKRLIIAEETIRLLKQKNQSAE